MGTRVGTEEHPSVVHCSFLGSVDNVPFTYLAWIGRLRLAARKAEARTREALERAIDQALDLTTARGARPSFAHGGYGAALG